MVAPDPQVAAAVVVSVPATLAALAAVWQARRGPKGNGHGSHTEMLEDILLRVRRVDERLDGHIEDAEIHRRN